MTKTEFVEWLKNEVTVSGALQVNIPDKEYERIIDNEMQGIYENDRDASRAAFMVMPVSQFYTPEFRRTRTIKFPKCVLAVTEFQEMKRRNAMFGFNDPDFGYNKCFQSDIWLGSQMSLDSIAYTTIQWGVWDQLKVFTLVDIRHRWNWGDHSLTVLGHDPQVNVYCQLAVKNDECDMYEDYYVRKWVSAKCKLQANKLLTLFTTQLIGGVTINMSAYTEEANKDLEECKEHFNNISTVTWWKTTP